jgi:glutamate N-acetyltransferase/amino-acid N-acetyltransferase
MSVTGPEGFSAAGVACGIKSGGELDLCLLAADSPAKAAAVFTTNRAAAPPVLLSRSHLAAGRGVAAVVANSGCANAGTGQEGAATALGMARAVAERVGCAVEQVLVASTGPIGPTLPLDRVVAGIASAAVSLEASPAAGTNAATAIMTTDKVVKEVTVRREGFTIGGMAKGSGMIRPGMATMLGFLTTDAVVDPEDLAAPLQSAVSGSFHSLNIDGCASTNDTVVVLASGASGTRPDIAVLTEALSEACTALTEKMASDAEGASRVVVIEVVGAPDDDAARSAGRAMADSALVRASFYGGDPNWGRLLGAAGASSVMFDPADFAVAYQGVTVAAGGVAVGFDEAGLLETMAEGDLDVTVTLGSGPGRARVLTTDLTPEYVRFNGERS